ncbi:hypothetical protein GGE07_006367 [Sinorhizobium terangae]|uniref:Uncharacterized protein n=1 Tax=Sinorhizobium terangae TaxID=110322 RepID=A0A6N7LBZ2_SINTE|nr:hypothetical protein [Sinorhizobium terangae]MBB4189671.1 hypothetical protein [Sinorhizobium terangae]MQX15373.1 hypothetical protein [Sinorhizobium terangae]
MDVFEREQAFSDKFDCSFPYRNLGEAAALIEEARSISANAAFCVLYQIACPPSSAEISRETQQELLTMWVDSAASPLAASIVIFARHVFNGGVVTTEEALALMHQVAAADGQYAALAVVSHLAYEGLEGDEFDMIDILESVRPTLKRILHA